MAIEVVLTRNGIAIPEVNKSIYSFILSDSIHKLFPIIDFTMKDISGQEMENKTFLVGDKLGVSYNYERNTEELINLTYMSTHFESKREMTPNIMNGILSFRGEHEYRQLQDRNNNEIIAKNIKQAIDEITNDYTFSSKYIEDMQNERKWYRPFMTQQEMLEQVFKEVGFNIQNNYSPFYVFINSHNEFHFRSFADMFTQKTVKTFNQEVSNVSSDRSGDLIKPPMQILPLSEDYGDMIDNADVRYYIRNTNSIDYREEDRSIVSGVENYFMFSEGKRVGKVGILEGHKIDAINENNGIISNSRRRGVLSNKLFITTVFSPSVSAGKVIEVKPNIIGAGENNINNSIMYSGRYIVEKSYHTWDGEKNNGITQILASRSSIINAGVDENPNILYTSGV